MPEFKDGDGPENKVAASVEWLLKGDAAQRIVAAWHFGWQPAKEASGTDWQTPLLVELLNDSYSAVRLVAGRSLKTLPNLEQLKFDFLAPEPERRDAKSKAIEIWTNSQPKPAENPPAVLQQPSGTLDEKAIRRMLQLQDRRPVTITE